MEVVETVVVVVVVGDEEGDVVVETVVVEVVETVVVVVVVGDEEGDVVVDENQDEEGDYCAGNEWKSPVMVGIEGREDGVDILLLLLVGRHSLGCSSFLGMVVGSHSVLDRDHLNIRCVPGGALGVGVDRLDRCHTFLDVSDQNEEVP